MSENRVNILLAASSDYLPYGVVTAVSAKANLNNDTKLKVYFLYADIVKDIPPEEKNNVFEYAKATFDEYDIEYDFIDVKDKMSIFEGQNIGQWGKAISYTHYIYLLAQNVLNDVKKVIYLDTDMIVNTDLSKVYNICLDNYLVAMGAPRGFEEMGEDVCNSGFIVMNLKEWRKENTLKTLLEFGLTIPKCNFCDQNLLHQYFTVNNPDRILKVDKTYNIFPQLFTDIAIEDIKILHFTGWKHIKPWYDLESKQRAGYLWWKYARMTSFYEKFLFMNVIRNTHKHIQYKFFERIFSIKKLDGVKYLTFLGIQIKLERKNNV